MSKFYNKNKQMEFLASLGFTKQIDKETKQWIYFYNENLGLVCYFNVMSSEIKNKYYDTSFGMYYGVETISDFKDCEYVEYPTFKQMLSGITNFVSKLK